MSACSEGHSTKSKSVLSLGPSQEALQARPGPTRQYPPQHLLCLQHLQSTQGRLHPMVPGAVPQLLEKRFRFRQQACRRIRRPREQRSTPGKMRPLQVPKPMSEPRFVTDLGLLSILTDTPRIAWPWTSWTERQSLHEKGGVT